MDSLISRRAVLASSAASLAVPAAMASPAAAAPAAPTRLLVERRSIEVDGRAASVFGIRQSDGTPGLVLDPGQPFAVTVENRASEATIIHWHGQTPPFQRQRLDMMVTIPGDSSPFPAAGSSTATTSSTWRPG